jgi:hypothetical protein
MNDKTRREHVGVDTGSQTGQAGADAVIHERGFVAAVHEDGHTANRHEHGQNNRESAINLVTDFDVVQKTRKWHPITLCVLKGPIYAVIQNFG